MILIVILLKLMSIVLLSAHVPCKDMESYTETIPGTSVSFDMVAIPNGTFRMGSPASEKGRNPDEGPTGNIEVDAFWMGKFEVTWDEYDLFVYKDPLVDGVTRPTPPFVDMSFGMGKDGYPAVNMTHYAALAYCKWLTEKTGHFYRLPTEAEWEFACRAGNEMAYSFGADTALLDAYAWYEKNSNGKYQKVGTRKPNAWGLYDMHGNVAEWTLDQYVADYYRTRTVNKNPWVVPTAAYPHVVRGGHWQAPAPALRSAARGQSQPEWKQRDPQIPKSQWWLTDASFVGFRIVRPLKRPTAEQINEYFYQPIPDY